MNEMVNVDHTDFMRKYQKSENIMADIQTFSRWCLENLHFHSRGHIMPFYQGFWIRLQERGMRKRRLEELGVFGLFKGMLNHNVLKSQLREPAQEEAQKPVKSYEQDKLEFIKNPVIVEFLGLTPDSTYNETKLESSIISNLQKFLMEMGKGYAFVARQQHIRTEKEDYYIDLVFYNYILKCFVLIDLKIGKITHQDVGQMDMYVWMYDERKKSADDNPTLGIVLCSETDEDIARYSVLHGNEQLFASKYKLYLPTEEELRAEIETQKAMFYLQQQEREESELMEEKRNEVK